MYHYPNIQGVDPIIQIPEGELLLANIFWASVDAFLIWSPGTFELNLTMIRKMRKMERW